jgi:hypothetical protein
MRAASRPEGMMATAPESAARLGIAEVITFGYISRKRQRAYPPDCSAWPVLRADHDGQHPDLDDLA